MPIKKKHLDPYIDPRPYIYISINIVFIGALSFPIIKYMHTNKRMYDWKEVSKDLLFAFILRLSSRQT